MRSLTREPGHVLQVFFPVLLLGLVLSAQWLWGGVNKPVQPKKNIETSECRPGDLACLNKAKSNETVLLFEQLIR